MDNSAVKSQFGQILTAAKERRGDLSVDTMIVSSHSLKCVRLCYAEVLSFLLSKTACKRKEFIARAQHNMLEMKFESIVDYLCDGQGLFYFRPNGESYQILYFPRKAIEHTGIKTVSLNPSSWFIRLTLKVLTPLLITIRKPTVRAVRKVDPIKGHKDRMNKQSPTKKLSLTMTWAQCPSRCLVRLRH